MTVDLAPAKVLLAVLCLLVTGFSLGQAENTSQSPASPPPLTLQERVDGQMALERLAYEKRLWPDTNPGEKPSFEGSVPRERVLTKVQAQMEQFRQFESRRGVCFSISELDQELRRMIKNSRDSVALQAMFSTLNHDLILLRELIARPALINRSRFETENQPELSQEKEKPNQNRDSKFFESKLTAGVASNPISTQSTPSQVSPSPPALNVVGNWTVIDNRGARAAKSIWTGSEMIIWGGYKINQTRGSIGRYNPTTDSWSELSSVNAPVSRTGHSLVWTGTEMIIWGGKTWSGSDYTQLNEGARYNPTSDTWASTANDAGTSSERSDHSTIWTGTEMIIWGGADGGGLELSNGSRYNPSSDSWLPLSGTNEPQARALHSAVWTGTTMVVWGGEQTLAGVRLNSGGIFDPSSDTWSATSLGSNVPSPRKFHSSVWTGTEMIIWGGENGGTVLGDGARLDPTLNTWSSINSIGPAKRYLHGTIWTGSEMIIFGGASGQTNDPEPENIQDRYDGFRYDPSIDTWTGINSSGIHRPFSRHDFTSVWTGSEMIVWGGFSTDWFSHASGGRYNLAADSWYAMSQPFSVPDGRSGHTAVWTGNEMIVWGGGLIDTGGLYLPATDSWSPTSTQAPVPAPRGSHTAVWTGSEMIIWGGTDGSTLATGGRYNPVSDTWIATGTGSSNPSSRYLHTAIWTGTKMIVWGGLTGGIIKKQTGGQYDPGTDSWSTTSTGTNVPTARYNHTAVWTGTEMIIWGGRDTSYDGSTRSGSRYNPQTNSWTPPNFSGPSQRSSHTAIWTGTEMIIWGGATGALLDTGGRYDPGTDTWVYTSVGPASPTARMDHSAIWTGAEMIIWGGWDYTYSSSGSIYQPDADQWTSLREPDPLILGRRYHTAVWTGSAMIVWGGSGRESPGLYLGRLNEGGIYRIPECAGSPTGSDTLTVLDQDICADSGLTLLWSLPADWGDDPLTDQGISVFRDGIPLINGGCINLPSTASTCVDNTGANGFPYAYQVVFTNSCLSSFFTQTISGADLGSMPFLNGNNTASDLSNCEDSGVSVTWKLPFDWGDNDPGSRSIEVLRDGTPIGSGGCSGLSDTAISCTDNAGANETTFLYSVRFTNSCSLQSTSAGNSGMDSLLGEVPQLLGNNSAMDLNGCADSGVIVSWSLPSDWGDDGPGARTIEVLRDGVPLPSGGCFGLTSTETSCTDETGTNETNYIYSVQFTNSCSSSNSSNGESASDSLLVGFPQLSGNNTSMDLNGCEDSGVIVSWSLPSDWGDDGPGGRTIEVLRDGVPLPSGGCFSLTSTETSCTDETGTNETNYIYSVQFTNSCSNQGTSTGTSGLDSLLGAVPQLSGNNTANDLDDCADTGVTVSWSLPSDWGDDGPGGRSIEILRDGTPVGSGGCSGLSGTATSCTDNAGANETTFLYSVRFTNSCSSQSASDGDSGYDSLLGSVPQLAGNNSAFDVNICEDSGVDVFWSLPVDWGDSGPGARNIEILRDGTPLISGGCFGLSGSATACNDNSGTDGTTYLYTVRFTNSCASQSTTSGQTSGDIVIISSPQVNGSTNNTCNTPNATISTTGYDSYQWGEHGISIAGATSSEYRPWVSGNYVVTGTTPPCSANSPLYSTTIEGCSGGCGGGFLDEQGNSFSGWTPSSENSSGYGMIISGGFIQPVYGSAPPSNWYVSSYEKSLNQTLGVNENVVFEVGLKSLNPDPTALGAVQVQWLDDSGNVAAEITWNSDISASSSNGYLWMLAEGNFFVNEVAGTTPVVNYSLRIERREGLWTAYRNDVVLGTFTLAPTIEPTKVKLGFWRPDTTETTRAMQVDYITTGNTLASAVANSLTTSVSSAGSTMDLTWTDTPDATSYNVYEDTNPAGTFATLSGNVPSGNPGLTISMPGQDLMFFKIKAENACGEGP